MKLLLHLLVAATLFAVPQSVLGETLPSVVLQDQARIREHLASVEAYLRKQGTSHLSEAQREARKKNIDHLHDYWVAGVFPRNTLRSFPTPIFIDPAGRACAVGYLMIETGWEAAAKKVAQRENLAYVNDIRTPEVGDWVAQSGLTGQEVAWIQPDYGPYCWDSCPCDEGPVCGADGITYLNPCFAEECGEQEVYIDGCCTVGDRDLRVEGAGICRYDPSEPYPGEAYRSGADLCGDLVDPPPLPALPDGSGCSAVSGASAPAHLYLFLAGVTLLSIRRHGR